MSNYNHPVEILLIEDNEGDIILTKKAFKNGEISNNLSVCRNGDQGLDYLFKRTPFENASRPDLILLDLNMPGISGHEVLETIKENQELNTIPVIILTTSSSEDDVLRCYKLHASSYIKKPMDFHEFGEIMGKFQNYWFNVVRLPSKA